MTNSRPTFDPALHAALARDGACPCDECAARLDRSERRVDRVYVAFVLLALLYFVTRGWW